MTVETKILDIPHVSSKINSNVDSAVDVYVNKKRFEWCRRSHCDIVYYVCINL